MIRSFIAIVVLGASASTLPQDAGPSARLLTRRYQDGERLTYVMKGRNNESTYEVRLTSVVKKRPDGQFVEEYAWSDVVADGVARPLTAASREFRQAVTLAAAPPFTFPDLSRVQPGLIGPITDLLTFYSDMFWGTSENNRRARYYRLTTGGRAQLTAQTSRWNEIVRAINRVLRPAD